MRHKKRLFVVGALIIAGLSWFWWTQSRPPAVMFVFEFEARIEDETVALRSSVGCYPFKVRGDISSGSHTKHDIREHAFATKLKSGRTFFVSVPDICPYVRGGDGEYLGRWPGSIPPQIATPRKIVPLTYLVEGNDETRTVRLFTSLDGKAPSNGGFLILRSTVRQFNEATDSDLPELSGEASDPLAPPMLMDDSWAGTVFLPVRDAPKLEATWIDAKWEAGDCDIIRLNELGQTAVAAIDSYASSIGQLWPRLWRGTALSDLFVMPLSDEYDATAARAGCESVVPARFVGDRFEIEPAHAGTVELSRSTSRFRDLRLRASSFFFNGSQLSNDSERKRLPFVMQCEAQIGLYIPAILFFSRDVP
jgi:hypothetical protein